MLGAASPTLSHEFAHGVVDKRDPVCSRCPTGIEAGVEVGFEPVDVAGTESASAELGVEGEPADSLLPDAAATAASRECSSPRPAGLADRN